MSEPNAPDPSPRPSPRTRSPELKAMARIEAILEDLPPATAQRVVAWAESLTNDRVEEEYGGWYAPTDTGLER